MDFFALAFWTFCKINKIKIMYIINYLYCFVNIMHIANVIYVVYGTTLVRTKNLMSKSENQERTKRKTKYPNFNSKIWKMISIWISFKPAHLARPQLITVDSFCSRYIIIHFWETAHLPLPKANINTYYSLRAKCWLRGGVGGQLPRNV